MCGIYLTILIRLQGLLTALFTKGRIKSVELKAPFGLFFLYDILDKCYLSVNLQALVLLPVIGLCKLLFLFTNWFIQTKKREIVI